MIPLDLTDRWRSKAADLRRYGAEEAAATLERCADQLEEEWTIWRDEPLTVAEAAEESGYSEDYLRQLVREGRLPDSRPLGSQGPISIRRANLPRKVPDGNADRTVAELAERIRSSRRR